MTTLLNEISTTVGYGKESRSIREKKIKINNYYKQKIRKNKTKMVTQNNDKDDIVELAPQLTKEIEMLKKESIASVTNVSKAPKDKNVVHKPKDKSRSNKKQRLLNKNAEKPVVNNKGTDYSFIFNNLSKMVRKFGIFIEANPQFTSVRTYRDANVNVIVAEKKISCVVRFCLGEYPFAEKAKHFGNEIGEMKKDFERWSNNLNDSIDKSAEVQKTVDSYFDKHRDLKNPINKYVNNLETAFIGALRKASKQPHGYAAKLENVYQSWFAQSSEITHIDDIEQELNFNFYEQSFQLARALDRKFTILIGPTNSGKTYEALNILAASETGAYLAPLRLMAQEGLDSLEERGVIADLITGEEQKRQIGATHTSSTIEMCNTNKILDCAVIDEIQMIADSSRGWAWSQALVGVPAKHVVLVGSREALPFILPIINTMGEEYEIREFERKSPLKVFDGVSRIQDLKPGDAVVVFSRKNALDMKAEIEMANKSASIIYGNLSPEVRRGEARKFKTEVNPLLIATDAIGMGLNLPIKRVLFSTLQKYDGTEDRYLTVSEIKQIAGRAGRYGFNAIGEVGLLMNDNFEDHKILREAVEGDYETPSDVRISVAPNLKQVTKICEIIGKEDLYSALIFFKEKMLKDHKIYKAANLEAMIELAGMIKSKNLDLETGMNYACVPIDASSEYHLKHFFNFLNSHVQDRPIEAPKLPDGVFHNYIDGASLLEAENYVKLCMAYRWLFYKYPAVYVGIDEVVANTAKTNAYIEATLQKHIMFNKTMKFKSSRKTK